MMELVRFEPWHIDAVNEQTATARLRSVIGPEQVHALAQQKHSYSAMRDGVVIACGGVVEYHPGRGEAWAVLDAARPKDFIAIHHIGRRLLDLRLFHRVEAVVEIGFEAGHRWLKLLGFALEAPCMRGYGPDGRDYSLYARVS